MQETRLALLRAFVDAWTGEHDRTVGDALGDQRVQDWRRARTAMPSLRDEASAFAAAVARHVRAGDDPATTLGPLHTADLWLALGVRTR